MLPSSAERPVPARSAGSWSARKFIRHGWRRRWQGRRKRRGADHATDWERATAAVRKVLEEAAEGHHTVTYPVIVEEVPTDLREFVAPHLQELLDEMATETNAAGRGLLSAIAVESKSYMPPPAYFRLAARLGRDPDDPRREWKQEMGEVFRIWAKRTPDEAGD